MPYTDAKVQNKMHIERQQPSKCPTLMPRFKTKCILSAHLAEVSSIGSTEPPGRVCTNENDVELFSWQRSTQLVCTREKYSNTSYTQPCASMASATFTKPAMFAPCT